MGKNNTRPFIKIDQWIMKTPAWRDLSANARVLYLELLFRFDGRNNRSIGFGCREAADAINVGKSTAGRAFAELTRNGFIRKITPCGAGSNGNRPTDWLVLELVQESDDQQI